MKLKKCLFDEEKKEIKARYEKLYGPGDHSEAVYKEQKMVRKRYLTVITVFAAVFLMSLAGKNNLDLSIKTDDGMLEALKRPALEEGTGVVDVSVFALLEQGSLKKDMQLVIEPKNGRIVNEREEGILGEETAEEKTERKIDSAVRSLNQDTKNSKVILPSKLEDGTRLIWQEKRSGNTPLLILLLAVSVAAVYMSRFDALKKKERAAKESIIKELPEFINKTVLLLNAGEVMQQAFIKIMTDYGKSRDGSNTYFYEQLFGIYLRMRDTNSSMHEELTVLARRSGVRELMRVSGIIRDNVDKGSALAEKLGQESDSLWFVRKKQSEEKGRIAETKLTLPLVILLLALVMITIAPAIMEIR